MIGTAFAQAGATPQAGDMSIGSLIPILLMFVVLYFLMIRPQMKKAKEHKQMLDALQKGDEVVAMGIYGKVAKISDAKVTLEIADNVSIQVQKQAITTLLPKGTV